MQLFISCNTICIIVARPLHDPLHLLPDGGFTYTPNPGFTGKDKFFVKGTDNHSNSAQTAITLNVTLSLTPEPAKPIPTLGSWAQIILMLMLALIGSYGISARRADR